MGKILRHRENRPQQTTKIRSIRSIRVNKESGAGGYIRRGDAGQRNQRVRKISFAFPQKSPLLWHNAAADPAG